ncbi:hypothetical protein QTP88_022528 [Uroleucon formosanum]
MAYAHHKYCGTQRSISTIADKIMDDSQNIRDLLDSSFMSSISSLETSSQLSITSTLNNESTNSVFTSASNSPVQINPISTTSTTKIASKSSIKRKLMSDTGEYTLVPQEGKSEVWKKFRKVLNVVENIDDPDSPEQISTGFIACINCKDLYGQNSSTATLSRHRCNLGVGSKEKIDAYFEIMNKKKKDIPKKLKDETIEKCVKYCCMDIKPMYSIEGEGFKQFGQFLLDVGAKYGKIDIADILPHPTTVSRHIETTTKELRNNIFKDLFFIIEKKYCASTCDLWTDDFRRNSYMSITLHYIDDNWELNNRLLHTGQFPMNESKTGDNIRRFLYNFFFQISDAANKPCSNDLMSSITFVTDQGSNMLSALRNTNRLNCSAHLLNTVLRNLFDMKYLEQEEDGNKPLEPVITLLTECKQLVRFMKSTGKNGELCKGLVQEVETRWNTRFLMLQSVQNALPQIIQIHGENFNRIQNIDTELLTEITQFLEPFKKASDELEGDKRPTIQKVVLYQLLLKKHLQTYSNLRENIYSNAEELTINSILQKLGKRGLEFMDTKFKLAQEHEIAVFLFPKFKSLKMFSETDKARIIGNIELKLLRIDLEEDNRHTNLQEVNNITARNPNPSGNSTFSEWEDDENDIDQSRNYPRYKKEVEDYKNKYFEVQDDNILEFWNNQKYIFPLLSILAKQILAIPASSASSERSFSVAGRVIEERRSCLGGNTVDGILFLNNHFNSQK